MASPCSRFSQEVWEERYFGRLDPVLSAAAEAHLSVCESCRGNWEETVREIEFLRSVLEFCEGAELGPERRRDPRMAASGRVTLVLRRRGCRETLMQGELRDESRGGLGLICGERLRPGCRVVVVREASSIVARVRWCRAMGERYGVGLELQAA